MAAIKPKGAAIASPPDAGSGGLHPGAGMAIMGDKSARPHPIDRMSAVTAGLGTRLLALLSALFSNTP